MSSPNPTETPKTTETPNTTETDHVSYEMKPPIDNNGFGEEERTFDDIDERKDMQNRPAATNKFQARRNITHGMYDVALLMANVSQLKSVLDAQTNPYYIPLICLLALSITLHITSAILLYFLMIKEKNAENKRHYLEELKKKEKAHLDSNENIGKSVTYCSVCTEPQESCQCWKIYKIDVVATMFVFAVTVINVFVTALASTK